MWKDTIGQIFPLTDGAIRSFLKRLDMIKLKQEVNKSEIMRELKAEAEIAFENTWQKEMQIRAYMNGAHDLFKKLRIAHVSGSLLADVRQAVADYMRTEGCSCCRDYEGHKINEARLGKLLKVKKYDDGSGYDFSKYRSKQ